MSCKQKGAGGSDRGGKSLATRRARVGKTPGVTVYQRRPSKWSAKWRDPDSGKWVQHDLPAADARTIEARTRFAQRLSAVLQQRDQALRSGAVAKTGMELKDALGAYFASASLRPRTRRVYTDVADEFTAWCTVQRVQKADDITAAVLARYAVHVRRKTKRVALRGGIRGETHDTGEPRSPWSINRELRALASMTNRLRKMQLLPLVSRSGISDALEGNRVVRTRRGHLTVPACQALWLASADSPLRAFIRVMLLTGMRLNEGRQLEWDEVDLEQGFIRLPPEKVKIARGRLIDLQVSPSLLRLFESLPRRGPYVFGPGQVTPLGDVRNHVRRLPFQGLQELRRTCSTYLSCMPSYGVYRAAERCGHSVVEAQRDYAGQVRIDPEVRFLEEAMGLAAVDDSIAAAVQSE